MARFFAAAALLGAAVVIWLTVFFGGAYVIVWSIETFEGDMSECWWAECGTFGELLDDHDLLAVVLLAVFATVPSAAFLRKTLRRFETPTARPGE